MHYRRGWWGSGWWGFWLLGGRFPGLSVLPGRQGLLGWLGVVGEGVRVGVSRSAGSL
ncbi:hypothetical protein FRAAL3776 [Frankia alni ACN14a]|uniref:Uncharacterized protein n=1 Tax=Frankia alni (strain DSM 45986 / CECT 9034 / ACN14a) TaxID=326424 RepID=Q0RJ93_FRAAA|nr:hypothetical protein FRAAL3776 [Frankia alni ACN14a]